MYQLFRKTFEEFPVITLADIRMSFPDFDTKNLINWQRKEYLIKLRNGYYIFSDRKINEHLLSQVANKLYEPSYVSLESALSFYGFIPEGVYSIQSVSTRKTNAFTTPVGTFHYYTIKNSFYFGYRLINENSEHPIRMASPEKAMLDFLYLRPDINDIPSIEALRWNRDELANIDSATLEEYLLIFKSPTLQKKIDWLYTYLHA
ncbi:MAG: hypothetical protein KBB64_12805 [Bacteroidia bacterium]|jgi:predicted transcriptional regulator of viral defense system|nr:hypothetical protein [Bacteroidia bacterium]